MPVDDGFTTLPYRGSAGSPFGLRLGFVL